MWSIWNHRNRVLLQGILPNPIEFILTSQSLTFRYQEAFQTQQVQKTETTQQPIFPSNQEWQLILKVTAYKYRSSKRSGYAYEAKTLDGNELFSGGASCGRKTQQLAIQDAVGEAILKAMQMGYNRILVLNNNSRLVQICNQGKNLTWTEQNLVADLTHLQQLGLTTHYLFVPKDIISHVIDLAVITTCFPVSHYRYNPVYV